MITKRRPLVAPLDPTSEKGRRVAAYLTVALDDIERAIAAREARGSVRPGDVDREET